MTDDINTVLYILTECDLQFLAIHVLNNIMKLYST